MEKTILVYLLFTISFSCFSQESDKYWFTDFSEAKSYSLANNTPILMVFAGSDWCRPCIQFKKDILTDESFCEYAAGNLTILYLDFPRKKSNRLSPESVAHNEQLAAKHNRSGAFPHILLLDGHEKVLGTLEFNNQGAAQFIISCEALQN